MSAPQRTPRKTGWNTYYPWLLALSATICTLALVIIAISWIPVEPVPGVPPNPLSGPYLPGGATILFAVIAARQLYLRSRRGQVVVADALEPPPQPAHEHDIASGALKVVVIAASGLILLVTILTVVGFSNGYSYRVVDQEARAATTYSEFTGTYSVVDRGTRLCVSGDDYYACVEMHRTMYNSVCAGRPLNNVARSTCEALSTFVTDTQAQYAGCGYGCQTAGDGDWGWSQLTLEADTKTGSTPELPEISHEERCDFDLGIIRFGQCPGRPE